MRHVMVVGCGGVNMKSRSSRRAGSTQAGRRAWIGVGGGICDRLLVEAKLPFTLADFRDRLSTSGSPWAGVGKRPPIDRAEKHLTGNDRSFRLLPHVNILGRMFAHDLIRAGSHAVTALRFIALDLVLGACVSADLVRTLRTGRAHGKFGIIRRQTRPDKYRRYVYGDCAVLVLCAVGIVWAIVSPESF
jgi:hypothetical protein